MGVRSYLCLVAAIGLASCTIEEQSSVDQGVIGSRCDADFCTTNSPMVSVYGTWEFKLDGTANLQGFSLIGLGKDRGAATEFFTLAVHDSRIYGLDAWGNIALQDVDLIGAKIYLDHNGAQHAIAISDVGAISEVVAKPNQLQTYVLDWSDVLKQELPHPMAAGAWIENNSMPLETPPTPVCPAPEWIEEPYVGSMVEWDESTVAGMSVYESLVFEGDRFDPEKRTVAHTADDNWFNVACGKYTLAKLRLTRNTIHTAPAMEWRRVQAAFKMLSADYCGTGKAFTFTGEPLVWRDRADMDYFRLGAKNELEARWDESGAICLSSPRLARTANPTAAKTFPDVWVDIKMECGAAGKRMRSCTDVNPLNWQTSDELVTSANYD
jgi:hypothetical protein